MERAIPADPAMAFSIASITKAFTGVALLKLVEAGHIDLDADIQRYVPHFPRHARGRPVTLRMLAHHLGAVRHWGPERNERVYARHFDDVHDILALFRDDPWVPDLAPLVQYSYSSYGYNALGMAIQSASGRPFQQYLRWSCTPSSWHRFNLIGPDSGVHDDRRATPGMIWSIFTNSRMRLNASPTGTIAIIWPAGGSLRTWMIC